MFNRNVQPMTTFKDDLRSAIQGGGIWHRAIISPDMAAEMLALNTRNRPVTKSKVKEYTRQMNANAWHYTRVPVIFSDQGRVLDGQHRLLACIEANASFETDVAFGAPDDSFAYIDVGKSRSSADIFAINGLKNSVGLAAMTKLVVAYDMDRHPDYKALTGAELYEEFLKRQDIERSLTYFHKFQKARIAPQSIMAAMHYICAQKNRAQADAFFDVVVDGHGASSRTAPEFELHKRLIKNAMSQEKMSHRAISGLTLEAWNRSRSGLSGRGMRFDPTKPFPRAR